MTCVVDISTSGEKDLKLKVLLSNIFTRVSYKIDFSNQKGNQVLLAIDILKDDARKDLLHIASQNIEKTYKELLRHDSPVTDMQQNGEAIFLYLLQDTCDAFLLKQYGCELKLSPAKFRNSLYIKELLTDIDLIFQIPFYGILNPKASEFISTYSPIYSYASESFLEALVDNLIIETANCVAYYSIINFSFLYPFRKTLYRSNFLSLRSFERFKNNLVWTLKINSYIRRPNSVYSSRYNILLLRTNGICTRSIYADRCKDLQSLPNLPLTVVTLIELKDFILSRVDELLYFLSRGIRFTLTSVIGQFIGLVWRGVIEGLKNKNVN